MIETERLLLRPLRVEDVDVFVALHEDERVNRFVGAYSRQQALERLELIERQWAERGHGLCAVELKADGEFIGRCGEPAVSPAVRERAGAEWPRGLPTLLLRGVSPT